MQEEVKRFLDQRPVAMVTESLSMSGPFHARARDDEKRQPQMKSGVSASYQHSTVFDEGSFSKFQSGSN